MSSAWVCKHASMHAGNCKAIAENKVQAAYLGYWIGEEYGPHILATRLAALGEQLCKPTNGEICSPLFISIVTVTPSSRKNARVQRGMRGSESN